MHWLPRAVGTKHHKRSGFKQQKQIVLTVLKSSSSRCQQRWLFLRSVRGNVLQASCLASAGNLWHSRAYSCTTPISSLILKGHSPAVGLCTHFPFLWGPPSCWSRVYPNDLILTNYICEDPISKEGPSQSEGPGVRTPFHPFISGGGKGGGNITLSVTHVLY